MEHSELVAEMAQVEHLTTQERLHLARRRRIQQLKVWAQREREWLKSRPNTHKKDKNNPHLSGHNGKTKRNIYFSDSVMLLEAAARNDIDEVRRLLSRSVTPDATNEDGLTALHQCCIDNNQDMLQLLLDKGANVNAEDSEKWTPLHAAATCGHLQLVKILIQRGANLLAVNADGNMPYDICEDEATLDCIEGEMAARGITQRLIDQTRASTERKMLKDLKQLAMDGTGDLEVRDQHGATPLHIAAANGYIKVVEFLLDNHVSTDVKDHDLWQPVHAAACWGHMEVLEVLVHNGADLNAKNKHDETPSDICEDPEMRSRIAQLLIERESRLRVSAGSSNSGGGGTSRRGTPSHRPPSSSSRVQSIRRTSLRERGLTAKHDAHEEARMRQTFGTSTGIPAGLEGTQNAEQIPNGTQKRPSNGSVASSVIEPGGSQQSTESSPKQSIASHNGETQSQRSTDMESQSSLASQIPKITNPLYDVNSTTTYPNHTPVYNGYNGNKKSQESQNQFESKLPNENGTTQQKIFNNGVRKAPEGQDNDSYMNEDDTEGHSKELMMSHNHMDLPTDASSATHYTTDNNGKINVHVTVMINAGTLADLKKQRSQNRNSSPTESSLITNDSVTGQTSLPSIASQVPVVSNGGDVPRFSGNTSEVVGDARSRRCCVIM